MIKARIKNFINYKEYKKITKYNYFCHQVAELISGIFSIKNEVHSTEKRKVITILGIKIKIKPENILKKKFEAKFLYPHRYKNTVKRLSKEIKKRKLKVCFLVSEPAKWNMDYLVAELEKSEEFESYILVTNLIKTEHRPKYSHVYGFFSGLAKNVKIAWDEDLHSGIDLKKFSPDIVFYQQPWDLFENQNIQYVSRFALTMYCSYSIESANATIRKLADKFYSKLYKYYVFSENTKHEIKANMKYRANNMLPIGHPKLDVYKDYKTENYKHEYVIYAPHHSILQGLKFGTFHWNGNYILDWAKKHPEIKWLFKPHPRFRLSVIETGIMSEQECNSYYNEWGKIGTSYFDGNYFDLFKKSKCLITDCGSFLIEYLPTEMPVIHLKNTNSSEFPPTSRKIDQCYYQAYNVEELKKYLKDIVINGNDPLKNSRKILINELNLKDCNASRKILNELKDTFIK